MKTVSPPGKWRGRPFCLDRHVDVTGKSGTGIVACGVQIYPSGQCVLWWVADPRLQNVSIYKSINQLLDVHGHGSRAATSVVWLDTPEDPAGLLEENKRLRALLEGLEGARVAGVVQPGGLGLPGSGQAVHAPTASGPLALHEGATGRDLEGHATATRVPDETACLGEVKPRGDLHG